MGNIIQIKRGNGVPDNGKLAPYELGIDTSDSQLYFGGVSGEAMGIKVDKAANATNATNATHAGAATKVNNALTIGSFAFDGSEAKDATSTIQAIKVDKATSADTATNATNATNLLTDEGDSGPVYKNFSGIRSDILDAVYPVGSIYMSVNAASPATLFGGSWERIQDRFLLAASSSYSAGATGGEAAHTLTASEMPSHGHTFSGKAMTHDHATFKRDPNAASYANHLDLVDTYGTGNSVTGWAPSLSLATNKQMRTSAENLTPSGTISSTGGGNAHNNMPPYLAVYMWKRTA